MNRLTPKAQGTLLEAMAERQVTIDNERYQLSSPFMVIATQNPYEMEGTFMLIEAQKDRFTYNVQVNPLSAEDEMKILARDMNRDLDLKSLLAKETAITSPENIAKMQEAVRTVYASEDILGYIADLVTATRKHSDVKLGVSTRGSLALLRGAQAYAAIQGRDYIIPDDVKHLVPYVFSHRIMLKREAQLTGVTVPSVISAILESVPVR
jgi:MoxR-like ATPase